MQSFLNARSEVRSREELPEEFVAALGAGGWPSVRSAKRLAADASQCSDVFEIDFSADVPAKLAPIVPQGSRSRAVLHVIVAELGTSTVFAPSAPASVHRLKAALALAASAGAVVPNVWMSGELARHGSLRRVQYVLLEALPAGMAADGPSVPFIANAPSSAAVALPRYDDATGILLELRKMAVASGASELEGALGKLLDACRTDWQLPPAPPRLLLPDATGRLDSCAPWATAAVCDERLVRAEGSPWELVRAASDVVRARWLIDLLRRTPGTAPRCELATLLVAHDAGQALLVEKGWLPQAVVSPGSSCARLAETFPEEICPCY
jgi:hypothetical protein